MNDQTDADTATSETVDISRIITLTDVLNAWDNNEVLLMPSLSQLAQCKEPQIQIALMETLRYFKHNDHLLTDIRNIVHARVKAKNAGDSDSVNETTEKYDALMLPVLEDTISRIDGMHYMTPPQQAAIKAITSYIACHGYRTFVCQTRPVLLRYVARE